MIVKMLAFVVTDLCCLGGEAYRMLLAPIRHLAMIKRRATGYLLVA